MDKNPNPSSKFSSFSAITIIIFILVAAITSLALVRTSQQRDEYRQGYKEHYSYNQTLVANSYVVATSSYSEGYEEGKTEALSDQVLLAIDDTPAYFTANELGDVFINYRFTINQNLLQPGQVLLWIYFPSEYNGVESEYKNREFDLRGFPNEFFYPTDSTGEGFELTVGLVIGIPQTDGRHIVDGGYAAYQYYRIWIPPTPEFNPDGSLPNPPAHELPTATPIPNSSSTPNTSPTAHVPLEWGPHFIATHPAVSYIP